VSKQATLQNRLTHERALIGLLQSHPNPSLTEMAGMCGYDFVMFDAEHGIFSETDYLHAFQAAAAARLLAMVRLARHDDTHSLGRYLDMGVQAIVVPNVSTAEQAHTLVRAMEYPPAGTRGSGASLHRATRYGMDLAADLKAPRSGASLLVIIESALGVTNADEILAVDGLDGVIIGPSDLSADLGCSGDFSQPVYAQAVARIEHAAVARGKLLGTAPHAGSPIDALVARGHRLLIICADMALIREAMSAQAAKAKSSLAG
jgi:4-hydroxy-2-oxoheptanedioate aldolase